MNHTAPRPIAAFIASGVLCAASVCTVACVVEQRARQLHEAEPIRMVQTTAPRRGPFVETVSFLGFVEPKKLLSLHFLLAGRVSQCRIKEGQSVVEGEEICRLDQSAVDLEVARTRNALKAAERVLATNLPEKQKALFEAGVIGQAEFEQVRVQSETAKAQQSDAASLHEMALKKQREHQLRAPWDGVVTKLFAKPGQPIAPDMPASIVSDDKGVQVRADLHAASFAKLKVGASGRLTAISSKRVPANILLRVAQKSTAVQPSTQSFQVSLGLVEAGDAEGLVSGILVAGDIELASVPDALLIPESSLNSWRQDGSATIYIHGPNEGRLKLVHIHVGAVQDGWVRVMDGLKESDAVVVDIGPDFVDGMRAQTRN